MPPSKAKRNLGVLLLFVPWVLLIVTLALWSISLFVALTSFGAEAGYLPSLGQSVRVFVGVLGIISILGILVGWPFGIYLLCKHSQSFSVGKAIAYGWHMMKTRFWFFTGIVASFFVLEFLGITLTNMFADEGGVSMVFTVAWYLVYLWFMLGVLKVSVKLALHEHVSYSMVWSAGNRLLSFIAATILYLLIVFVGILLLIVPGCIWMYKYYLYPYFIIEQNLGPLAALKKSGEVTKGAKMDLFGFYIVLNLIIFAGMLALIVGLFAAIPIVLMANAYAYLALTGRTLNFSAATAPSTPPAPAVL